MYTQSWPQQCRVIAWKHNEMIIDYLKVSPSLMRSCSGENPVHCFMRIDCLRQDMDGHIFKKLSEMVRNTRVAL